MSGGCARSPPRGFHHHPATATVRPARPAGGRGDGGRHSAASYICASQMKDFSRPKNTLHIYPQTPYSRVSFVFLSHCHSSWERKWCVRDTTTIYCLTYCCMTSNNSNSNSRTDCVLLYLHRSSGINSEIVEIGNLKFHHPSFLLRIFQQQFFFLTEWTAM